MFLASTPYPKLPNIVQSVATNDLLPAVIIVKFLLANAGSNGVSELMLTLYFGKLCGPWLSPFSIMSNTMSNNVSANVLTVALTLTALIVCVVTA